MPIRINLLAEEQAAEELRRKDPVKRAMFIAGVVVGVVILFAVYNHFSVGATTRAAEKIKDAYAEVEEKEMALKEMRANTVRLENNLFSLHRLATNRFLWAAVLDDLQHCFNADDGIKLTKFETRQTYQESAAITPPPETGVKPIPAKSVESISFMIHAEDRTDKYSQFMERIRQRFAGKLKKGGNGVRLEQRTEPIELPDGSGSYRAIVIECIFPDTTREP